MSKGLGLTVWVCAIAALLAAPVVMPQAHAQGAAPQSHRHAGTHGKKTPNAPPAAPQQSKLPPRAPFTAADDAVAAIPGMPDARFWADSIDDFNKALPAQPGPWLALSTGGSDGAFGAGLVSGLAASGHRPDYAVVTGVSTGALMAPFVFAGPRYDARLQELYTKTSAADIFEAGSTGESFLDTWPLKDLIAKEVTPELVAEIAAQHQAGRRLFVVSTDLDAERSVVWNMGAIAVHAQGANGDAALKLFRSVMLASGSIPGAFPPVFIDVEGNGKKFSEMHVDGGVGGQFFVAPPALMQSNSGYKIPATQLFVVINSGLAPDFDVVERVTPLILVQTVGAAVKTDLRLMLDRAFVAAKNSGVDFNVASIPGSFDSASRGAFDPKYMQALFDLGFDMGKSGNAFAKEPPPFAAQPRTGMTDPKTNPMTNPIANPMTDPKSDDKSQGKDQTRDQAKDAGQPQQK